jgi:dihydroorotate dehydrogenase electron transfer subunit
MPPPPLHRAARILEVEEVARDTRSYTLDLALGAEPGQFVMVWVPRLDEKPFCVAGDAPLTLTVRRVGPLTEELHELHPGGRLWVRGPFGHGFSARAGRLLLVGGGYGAAPLGFLCSRAALSGASAVLAVGARSAADLLIPRSAHEHAAAIHTATEDGSSGLRGLVTGLAGDLLERERFDRVCACGPNSMLDAVAAIARAAGIPAELSFERYMRCGIGVCGSCEREGRLVCSDGPVFRYGPDGRPD